MKKTFIAFALAAMVPASAVMANEITVGLIVGETGPGASLGIPYKSTFNMVPDTLGGLKARYIMLDDATDTTLATKQARKLIQEDKVDLIFGSGNVPTAVAVSEVTNEAKVPQIALTPTPLKPDTSPWTFSIPQPMNIMSVPVVRHMQANGVKKVGFIGFTDSWGDLVINGFKNVPGNDIEIVAEERYVRNDTSVAGQILKILAAKPDAVLIGGSGTPAALPHTALRERGYKGPIYHNPAVINKDFLRVGGKAVEGGYATTGPVIIAEQLDDSNPIKKVALDFRQRYEDKYGKGSVSAFAAYSWDAYLIGDQAVREAAKKAKPGTQEFRAAIRDALESGNEVVGVHGIYKMTPKDHTGVDERAAALVQVNNGGWKLINIK
ncbi:ABC transporter substrate-binding protein [Pusillimonas minor]|uniref:ABC transporter substrate-binding protein n=1 Tax=Pusillimonas minor TaxID=2697024 RepID=A0A842HMS8_9BURK|nr:ABC transporter substrate-binding protein [Pusillimonas minor]MBC2768878.1 ABC transporter substrate-binding protein [Pusillimonas minor]